jgi:hypothetical protein
MKSHELWYLIDSNLKNVFNIMNLFYFNIYISSVKNLFNIFYKTYLINDIVNV